MACSISHHSCADTYGLTYTHVHAHALTQDKLAYHRKKKTQVQTDRDIKRRLGERVEKFNDKGRSIYGEAWDEGDIPVKLVLAVVLLYSCDLCVGVWCLWKVFGSWHYTPSTVNILQRCQAQSVVRCCSVHIQ